MRTTPPIPDWIRAYRHPDYTNIYELLPEETRLFGTEALYGNWDAELLLLAKDYAPRQVIEERLRRGEKRPYRHGTRELDRMGWRTNENLETHLVPELGVTSLLYGSAFGSLMRNDGKTSGRLPDEARVVEEYTVPLLSWVVTELSNLQGIACLGNDALDTVSKLAGNHLRSLRLGKCCPISIANKYLLAFRLYHPSRAFAGGWPARQREWRDMAEALARR
jgi:hypothetical protein